MRSREVVIRGVVLCGALRANCVGGAEEPMFSGLVLIFFMFMLFNATMVIAA